jgi:predicted outer membrane repeat protein
MFNRRVTCIAAVLCATASVPRITEAANWYVATCGDDAWAGVDAGCAAPLGPKRTVQAAIDAATDGDTIFVLPGQYDGQVDFDGKEVHLLAPGGPGLTILDGQGTQAVVLCNSGEGPDAVLEGFTVRNGHNDASGGGMLNALSTPTIIGCVFRDNFAREHGGAIANVLASPTILDTVFLDNTARHPADVGIGFGGAVSSVGGVSTFQGCLFEGNYGKMHGGAVALSSNATATFDDCQFIENSVQNIWESRGGALYVDSASATVISTTFESNTGALAPAPAGTQQGGAVAIVNGGDASFNACTFTGNEAVRDGGAIFVLDATASAFGSGFTFNTAEEKGGAVYVDGGVFSGIFSGFQQNQAASMFGGAIAGAFAEIVLELCNISDNAAGNVGGALWLDRCDADIDGCSFSNNQAGVVGGAADVRGGWFDAVGCTFTGNSASHTGGAIAYDGSVDGAIVVSPEPLGVTITDCAFDGNTAFSRGGGFAGEAGRVVIEDSLFTGNLSGMIAGVGGGAYFGEDLDATISITQFIGNAAKIGAGFFTRADLDAVGCAVIGNTADQYGGGVACFGDGHARLAACTVEQNGAGELGAGIALYGGGTASILNTIVASNIGPFGVGAIGETDTGSAIEIRNSVVADNTSGGVFINNPGTQSSVANSIVWGNMNGDEIGGDTLSVRHTAVEGGYSGVNVMTSDPLFLNPAVGNYRLQAISPYIDAGDNSLVPPDWIDIDADGDTAERFPIDFDGSPRFQDHAEPNTGCGGMAVVDVGAFEAPGAAVPTMSPADLNGDGAVDGADLGLLLGAWGPCLKSCCLADLNGDGFVDGADLGLLLGAWS